MTKMITKTENKELLNFKYNYLAIKQVLESSMNSPKLTGKIVLDITNKFLDYTEKQKENLANKLKGVEKTELDEMNVEFENLFANTYYTSPKLRKIVNNKGDKFSNIYWFEKELQKGKYNKFVYEGLCFVATTALDGFKSVPRLPSSKESAMSEINDFLEYHTKHKNLTKREDEISERFSNFKNKFSNKLKSNKQFVKTIENYEEKYPELKRIYEDLLN